MLRCKMTADKQELDSVKAVATLVAMTPLRAWVLKIVAATPAPWLLRIKTTWTIVGQWGEMLEESSIILRILAVSWMTSSLKKGRAVQPKQRRLTIRSLEKVATFCRIERRPLPISSRNYKAVQRIIMTLTIGSRKSWLSQIHLERNQMKITILSRIPKRKTSHLQLRKNARSVLK